MNNKPRNPSAFPKTKTAGDASIAEGGMTLRDYFAAKAMAAIWSGLDDIPIDDAIEITAVNAYELADAMLAEREREQ